VHRRLSVAGGQHAIALIGEIVHHQIADVGIILDDKDGRGAGRCLPGLLPNGPECRSHEGAFRSVIDRLWVVQIRAAL